MWNIHRNLNAFVPLLLSGFMSVSSWAQTQTAWFPFSGTDGLSVAFTSNTREDNPVWPQIKGLNTYIARTSYAMSLGEPDADIAWLRTKGDVPDAILQDFVGPALKNNPGEAPLSKAVSKAGLVYDRISRRDLLSSALSAGRLVVGKSSFSALLVDDMSACSPELLGKIKQLQDAGLPIVWVGALPQRATGWANSQERDRQVASLVAAIKPKLVRIPDHYGLAAAMSSVGVVSPLQTTTLGDVRTLRRKAAQSMTVLLFNPTTAAKQVSFARMAPYTEAAVLDPRDGSVKALSPNKPDVLIDARRMLLVRFTSSQAAAWNQATWLVPPLANRPFTRWWWPGNAVIDSSLTRSLHSLHDQFYGGVEIQTLTAGLTTAQKDQDGGRIYQVGTPAFFGHLKTVFQTAKELGMTVDLTMGSGWPSGSPGSNQAAEQQLLMSYKDLLGPARVQVPVPAPVVPKYVAPTNVLMANAIDGFDTNAKLLRVLLARVNPLTLPETLLDIQDVTSQVVNGTYTGTLGFGSYKLIALYQNNTRHRIFGSAFPEDRPGASTSIYTLDHLDSRGMQAYVQSLGQPWLDGIAPYKPAHWFLDSFELVAELPWSSKFAAEFSKMHGYELTPYAPYILAPLGFSKYLEYVTGAPGFRYKSAGNMAVRIREDFELTKEKLFLDSVVPPLQSWAASNGIGVRVQAHGGYGDVLDIYKQADIPETEGLYAGGAFDFMKLASSAAHIAGRAFASCECFVSPSPFGTALSLEDYYYFAGNAMSAGITRVIYHGYAYSYPD